VDKTTPSGNIFFGVMTAGSSAQYLVRYDPRMDAQAVLHHEQHGLASLLFWVLCMPACRHHPMTCCSPYLVGASTEKKCLL
jgi:hypothetical protein